MNAQSLGCDVKLIGKETVKVLRLELSEREVRILRAVLSSTNTTDDLIASAKDHGVGPLDDDELIMLHVDLGEALK